MRCRLDVSLGLGVDAEQPGLERVVARDRDRDSADEGVALLLGVLARHAGELAGEGVGVDREPLVVVRGELDGEDVGYDGAPATHHGSAIVHLALHGGCDLDGLHLGLERARERAVDHAVEPLLEAVEQSHRASQNLALPGCDDA